MIEQDWFESDNEAFLPPLKDAFKKALKEEACVDAIHTFAPLKLKEIAARPLSERFSAISNIIGALEARYSQIVEDDLATDTDFTIAPKAIKHETAVLRKISSTIRFSKPLETMVIDVSQEAIDFLTVSTETCTQLLNWKNIKDSEQLTLLQQFHDFAMAKMATRLTPVLPDARSEQHAFVSFFTKAARSIEGKSKKGIQYGSASDDDGIKEISINTHPDSDFDDLLEPFDTLGHETSHIFEGFLRRIANRPTPAHMPNWLKQDAQLCLYQSAMKAYIPCCVGNVYESQFNERLARRAGAATQRRLKHNLGI